MHHVILFVDLLFESFHSLSSSFRKGQVSSLLGSVTAVKRLNITNSDMGPSYHTVSSEPFYYETAYNTVKRQKIPVVQNTGWCVTNEIIPGKKKI